MGKFSLKLTTLVLLLFSGIFIGMQVANNGMQQMKGYNDPSFPSPVHWSENNDGEIEAAVMGNDVHMDQLAAKKRQLEEMETYNFFSSLGKALAHTVTVFTQKFINFIIGLFQ